MVCTPQDEWRYLLSGGVPAQELDNPAPGWLSERAWLDVLALSALPSFSSLAHSFPEHAAALRGLVDSSQPHRYPTHTVVTHTGVCVCGRLTACVNAFWVSVGLL